MREIIQFLPLLIVVLVVVSIVRNVARAIRRVGDQAPPPLRRLQEEADPELAARTRRIQEEIRRKIAERRGTPVLTPPPVIQQTEGSQYAPVEPPVVPEFNPGAEAILERQQQLADQMRSLELARISTQRRATQAAAAIASHAASESGMLAGARVSLLADLRDPLSLRRAFLLREVLDKPVGLR